MWPFPKKEISEMVQKIIELTQTNPDAWTCIWKDEQQIYAYYIRIKTKPSNELLDDLYLHIDGTINLIVRGYLRDSNGNPGGPGTTEPSFGNLNSALNSLERRHLRQAFIKLGQERTLRGLERLELK